MRDIIKKYIKSFIIFAILIFICNILSVLHPYIVKSVLDIDFEVSNISNILIILFAEYLIVHTILAIMKNARNIYCNKLMAKILRDIREKLFLKVLKFKMGTFNKYSSSDIYTRMTADADNLFELFFGMLQILLDDIIYIVLMLVMMFLADVRLALIGSATIVIIAIVSSIFTKVLKNLDSKILDKRDVENKEFSEMYNKSKLTYLFGLQKDNIINYLMRN